MERQLTTAPHNHILTNTAVWSPDGKWIVYDIRSDAHGSLFDGDRIEQVNVETGEVQVLYHSKCGAKCGVATYNPAESKVVFILGPEHPTADWQYGPSRRQGVIVNTTNPGVAMNLDARNLAEPFTPGALRGGTHVHVFSPTGQRVSFTYNDDITHTNQRSVGVSLPGRRVKVSQSHPRNHNGEYFSLLISKTLPNPKPGSDEIQRAFEDGWVANRAIAFQGEVITKDGQAISEVFIADLPDDLTIADDAPLQGTITQLPAPPHGVIQRRLTFTADRKYPGISGPRHWLRSSPDGNRIACLMRDDLGIVQLCTISPNGGGLSQLTKNPCSIASAFTWIPDGQFIAHVMDGSIFITSAIDGSSHRLTEKSSHESAPLPEAVVFSPNGRNIAYAKRHRDFSQVFIVAVDVDW